MMKITGTIITLNAEKYILRAINSLQKICDEIIVLDSESSDSTRRLAESAGARVFTQPFLGDGKQLSARISVNTLAPTVFKTCNCS